MDHAFLDSTDAGWAECLRSFTHDVFQLPEYAAWDARVLGGEARALVVEAAGDRMLVPLVVRPIPAVLGGVAGWLDGVSPYGYGSPLLVSTAPGGSGEGGLGRALIAAARRFGLVSLFLRSHPRIPLPDYGATEGVEVVRSGRTLGIDLTGDLNPDSKRWPKSLRYEMRRLASSGFAVRHNAWEYLADFAGAYNATMVRRNADRRYLFDERMLRELRTALGGGLALSVVTDATGGFAAGCLWTLRGEIAHYFLAAAVEQYARLSPAKLLVVAAAAEAQHLGARVFHLGGGLGGREDSIYAFKETFSDMVFDYDTVRVVVDGAAYEKLVSARAAALGVVPDPSFFPSYRWGLD